jgi:hypothetical protein
MNHFRETSPKEIYIVMLRAQRLASRYRRGGPPASQRRRIKTVNGEAMKQTLDWPVSIVEASPSETKNQHVLASPTEFDKEFSRHRQASGKSEFYGTKVSDSKIQMLNPSLAVVTYTATLPAHIAATREGDFNAVAILRRISTEDRWKIVFITVPK